MSPLLTTDDRSLSPEARADAVYVIALGTVAATSLLIDANHGPRRDAILEVPQRLDGKFFHALSTPAAPPTTAP